MPVPLPTKWELGNVGYHPSKEHPGCVDLEIKPLVMDHDDRSKVGWQLEIKRWSQPDKGFIKVGTSEATITVEDGFLIVANRDGEKASLRLPKYISPNAQVVKVDPDELRVTLPRLPAQAA